MAEYIDRSELLRIEKLLDTDILRKSKTASTIYDQIMYDIAHIPAAGDVAPVKHGKWKIDRGEGTEVSSVWIWQCSNCGYFKLTNANVGMNYNYCPNCGAKMEGVE